MNTIPIITQREYPQQIFSPKSLKGKYCLTPFRTIAIDMKGDVGLCHCAGWMPQKIGNILENTLEDLLSNSIAQKVRQSITNGTFNYCNELTCGIIHSNKLVEINKLSIDHQNLINSPESYAIPDDIFLAMDTTCNLSCPSCRTSITKLSEVQVDTQQKIGKILYSNLFSTPSDRSMSLRLSSSGEVFASPLLLNFLQQINSQNFPNIKLWIQTNGLLAQSRWHHVQHLEKHIKNITITFDASSAATYEKLRRGGKWKDLLAALTFLKIKKESLGFELQTRMVVQLDNFQEISDFYELSKQFGADIIDYARITDWGTYEPGEFANIDVFNSLHPLYNHARKKLETVLSFPDVISSGGL
jgi:MoaA/NifB/PqqE/SkfB family radical SAM enzyme